MTYRDLLAQVQPGISVLGNGTPESHPIDYDGAETTPITYAIMRNERELNSALQGSDTVDGYTDELKAVAEEHLDEAQVQRLQEWVRARLFPDVQSDLELDDEAQEAVRDVLGKDAPFQPYPVDEADLMDEPNVPKQVLAMVDEWMVG